MTPLAAQAVAVAAARNGDPRQTRDVVAALLAEGGDVTAAVVLATLRRRSGADDGGAASAASAALAAQGAQVLVVGEPGYPTRLAAAWPELGAPLWLFAQTGGAPLPDGPAVAVVGTRHPTADGVRTARRLGRLLAAHGVTVVSGLARGIDQAAHQGALAGGGPTVAVLGTGFGVDYPAGDGALRAKIGAAGGLVTEYLPGVGVAKHRFLWRNRIVSGLADAVVVVEGRARSGALVTARLGGGQGRDVLAIPGSINAPASQAPLALIRDGAQCVTALTDVLEAIGIAPCAPSAAGLDASVRSGAAGCARPAVPAQGLDAQGLDLVAGTVLSQLGGVPASVNDLAAAAAVPIGEVMGAIATLTRLGLARMTPQGLVRGA